MPEEYINAQASSDIAFIFKQNIRDHHDSSGKALINCVWIEIHKITAQFCNEKSFFNCLQVSFCLLVGTFCIALNAAVPYRPTLQLIPLVGDQQHQESTFVPRTVLPATDLQAAATGHGM
jgi:hypothetical protein